MQNQESDLLDPKLLEKLRKPGVIKRDEVDTVVADYLKKSRLSNEYNPDAAMHLEALAKSTADMAARKWLHRALTDINKTLSETEAAIELREAIQILTDCWKNIEEISFFSHNPNSNEDPTLFVTTQNPYDILILDSTADDAEIKTRFRLLTKIFTPLLAARTGVLSDKEISLATTQIQKINAAYNILSSTLSKQGLDLSIAVRQNSEAKQYKNQPQSEPVKKHTPEPDPVEMHQKKKEEYASWSASRIEMEIARLENFSEVLPLLQRITENTSLSHTLLETLKAKCVEKLKSLLITKITTYTPVPDRLATKLVVRDIFDKRHLTPMQFIEFNRLVDPADYELTEIKATILSVGTLINKVTTSEEFVWDRLNALPERLELVNNMPLLGRAYFEHVKSLLRETTKTYMRSMLSSLNTDAEYSEFNSRTFYLLNNSKIIEYDDWREFNDMVHTRKSRPTPRWF